MPASQSTTQTRRRILRFGLESIRIDGRPNAYKQPQLVLKPQLELPPRRPVTGSRPRLPLWRHFLMVHVKDKADELVNLDLDLFKQSSLGVDSALRHNVTCSMPEASLVFHHRKSEETALSTLEVKFQNAADFNTVIGELRTLGIEIETQQHNLIRNVKIESFTLRPSQPSGQGMSPVYMPSSSPRTLDSSSPLPTNIESHTQGLLLHRPPSQPPGQSTTGWQANPRAWSPGIVPSRPATALGVPGILGEGIYKVSKIGSIASHRPRMRRTPTILEHQGSGLYTVSKHFDKTLNREDILRSSRSRYMQRALSLNPQGGGPTLYPTRTPSLGGTESRYSPSGINRVQGPSIGGRSGAASRVTLDQHQKGLARPRTTDDMPEPTGFTDSHVMGYGFLPTSESIARPASAYSQTETALGSGGHLDDISLVSSSQTLAEAPGDDGATADDWLLQLSQIQHRGFCAASKVWEDFMAKAEAEKCSTARASDEVLSKFEADFKHQWEELVNATTQQMRGGWHARFAF